MTKLNYKDLIRNLVKRAHAERYEDGFRFDMRHVVGDYIIVHDEDDEFGARLELYTILHTMFGGN